MIPLSASQFKLYGDCKAKWGGVYLENDREPDSKATDRGKAVHAEMEAWCEDGALPTDPVSLAMLPHAPAPGTAHVERELSFATPSSTWRGFVDITRGFDHRLGSERKLDPEEWDNADITIQDWKSTSKKANVKSVDALLEDVQANLYAYEAFLHNPVAVYAKWVYAFTSGQPGPAQPVDFAFHKPRVIDFIGGEIDPVAGEIQKLYSIRPKWAELEKNTGHCYAYGRQCHKFNECKPNRTLKFAMANPNVSGATVSDFFKSIASQFPGLPTVPGLPTSPSALPVSMAAAASPELRLPFVPQAPYVRPPLPSGYEEYPTRRAAPALSGAAAINKSWNEIKPESGFVNPPEAPLVAASSPEHAASLQGISAPLPAMPANDEIEAMTKDQAKALCELAGLDTARKRENTLKEMLRAHRASGGGVRTTQLTSDPAIFSFLATTMSGNTLTGVQAVETVQIPDPPVQDTTDAAINTPADAWCPGGQAQGGRRHVAPPTGFVLYVNCIPVLMSGSEGDIVPVAHIIADANRILKERKGFDDYRFIDFGKGAAEICGIVRDMEGDDYFANVSGVSLDSRTPEGSVLLETLTCFADRVVRGF